MTGPLITCLCLTHNRREFLPRAIESFRLQTHANRELLIVATGAPVLDLLPSDPRIRLLRASDNVILGEKRNIGCEVARGELIAIWDDDDFSAPDRLAEQAELLAASGKAVVGYYALLFHETRRTNVITETGKRPGAAWWKWTSMRRRACGTSLCFRRDWWQSHPFAPVSGGEDDRFYAEALAAGEAVAVDGSDRMFATNHPGNVSGRLIGGAEWEELAERPAWAA